MLLLLLQCSITASPSLSRVLCIYPRGSVAAARKRTRLYRASLLYLADRPFLGLAESVAQLLSESWASLARANNADATTTAKRDCCTRARDWWCRDYIGFFARAVPRGDNSRELCFFGLGGDGEFAIDCLVELTLIEIMGFCIRTTFNQLLQIIDLTIRAITIRFKFI